MTEEEIRNRYFRWLCGLVDIQCRRGKSYWILAQTLHKKEFYSILGNDDDRGSEGKHLRFIFASEISPGKLRDIISDLEGPCSVLEMMISFAMRISSWLEGDADHTAVRTWFMIMVKNLGLDQYDDDHYLGYDNPTEEIDRKLDIFLTRKYKRDGRGGLFPLRNPERDQRKAEIWYQLNDYLKENRGLWTDD